jgi:hypothetical protein
MASWRRLNTDEVNWVGNLVDLLQYPSMGLSEDDRRFVANIYNWVGQFGYDLKLSSKQINKLKYLRDQHC